MYGKGIIYFSLIAVGFVMFPPEAYANVETGTATAMNYTMKYPLVYIDNKQVQDIINADIYTYIYKFKSGYEDGEFISGKFDYEVMYEDTSYVSLLIHEDRYAGGAHGMPSYIGLNYDKKTGKNLPLSYFVRLRPEDKALIYDQPVYNSKNVVIPPASLNEYRFQRKISGNYYLLGNGDIALLYQPYEMACYAAGATHIKLTPKWQDFFNRKNKY